MFKTEPGRPPFGILPDPVGPIERDAYDLKKPMGGRAGWWARRFGFKHFQYMGAVSDDLFVGCAIADAGLVANVFAYVFEPSSGRMHKRVFESPLRRGFTYNPDPDQGESRFVSRHGSVSMRASVDADTGQRTKSLQVDLANDLFIEFSFDDHPPYEPLRICTQTGATGWTYAQKVAGVPARGSVRSALGEFDLTEQRAYAHHDFTAGYLRSQTNWYWACLSGEVESGQALGLNLSSGVNESGVTENCIWVNGRITKVDSVLFECDEEDLDKPWQVGSHDGRIELDFTPQGAYRSRRNALVAATNFHQMFGCFKGVVRTDSEEITVQNMKGFAERQYIKW